MRILRFTALWCQPCVQLVKNLKEINTPIHIEAIDIDNHPEVAAEYGIKTIPTLVLLDGNIEVKRHIGLMTVEKLKEWVNVKGTIWVVNKEGNRKRINPNHVPEGYISVKENK